MPQPHPKASERFGPPFVLGLLLVAHFSANLWWLERDNLPQMGDYGVHLGFANAMYRELTDPRHADVLHAVASLRRVSTGIYTPMLHVAGAFTAATFGPEKSGFVIVNSFAFLLLLTGCYALARCLLAPWFALLATAFVSLTPFLYGASRIFVTDILSAAFVVWALVALARSDGFQRRIAVGALALVLGAGFWARWTTALYCAAPIAVVLLASLWTAWRDANTPMLRRLLSNLGLFLVLSLLLVIPWFALRAPDLNATYQSDFAPVEQPFRAFRWSTWLAYPLIIINKGTFAALYLLACAGLATSVRRAKNWSIVSAWLLGSLAILMIIWVFRNPAPRYVIPLLPACGILAALAISALPGRRVRAALTSITLFLLAFQYGNITFGPYPYLPEAHIPVAKDFDWFGRNHDPGIVLWDSKVHAFGAKYGPPFQGPNWIDRALNQIVAIDASRYYLRWPQANVQLVGALKEAVETVQTRYWPQRNPLAGGRRERIVPGRFADWSRNREPMAAIVDGRSFDLPLRAPLDMGGAAELEIALGSPKTVAAFSIEFDAAGELLAYWRLQYRPGPAAPWSYVTPQVTAPDDAPRFQFYAFEPVEADRFRLLLDNPVQSAAITHLALYALLPQPRPIILAGVCDTVEELSRDDLDTKDYIIVASRKLLQTEDYPQLSDFEVMDRFEAGLFGYWDDRHFVLLARRPPGLLNYETRLPFRVKPDAHEKVQGRWDLPFWRAAETAAVHNPQGADGWQFRPPAAFYIDLNGPCEISALEIVPWSESVGIGPVSVDYWREGAWRTFPRIGWRIDAPRHKTGERQWDPKTLPGPLPESIVAERLRIRFHPGLEDPAATLGLANVFIYGSPQEENRAIAPNP